MAAIVLPYALPLLSASATTQLVNKQLISAVQSGSIAKVTRLIGVGANVNSVDNLGRSIAHHAVLRDDLQLLEFLLNSGADINAADSYGDNLLHTSIAWERDAIAEFLLQRGASRTHQNTRGLTPSQYAQKLQRSTNLIESLRETTQEKDLHPQEQQPPQEDQAEADTATQNEQNKKRDRELIGDVIRRVNSEDISIGELMDFIESGIDLNLLGRIGGGHLRSLLKEVVLSFTKDHGLDKAIEIIDLMIANGADIDIRCGYGSLTPLMFAANLSCSINNLTRVVEFLLKRGANLHLKNDQGRSVCELASHSLCKETYKFVLKAMGKDSAELLALVDEGRRQRVRDLLAAEDSHKDDLKDVTELHTLVERDDLQAVRNLLAAEDFDKSELKIENKAGQLPFDVAVASKHYGIAAVLLRNMIDINKRDPQGWPPLNYALLTKDRELIQEFIRDGAIPTVGRGHYGGQTAFDLVEKMGIEEMLVEILRDEGKLNYTKGKHDAPLIWAVEHKQKKPCKTATRSRC